MLSLGTRNPSQYTTSKVSEWDTCPWAEQMDLGPNFGSLQRGVQPLEFEPCYWNGRYMKLGGKGSFLPCCDSMTWLLKGCFPLTCLIAQDVCLQLSNFYSSTLYQGRNQELLGVGLGKSQARHRTPALQIFIMKALVTPSPLPFQLLCICGQGFVCGRTGK